MAKSIGNTEEKLLRKCGKTMARLEKIKNDDYKVVSI
jgi:hypothetical protein